MCGEFRDVEGISVQVGLSAVGACGCLLSEECGGCHLSSCHAVYGVVDEDGGDVLSAREGVERLAGSDAGEVAVALVCEDEAVFPQAFYRRCHGKGTAVCRLLPVDVYVSVGEDGAADGTYTDGLVLHAHFFNHFRHEFVDDAVGAAGAIVHRGVVQQRGLGIDEIFRFYDFAVHCIFFS